MNQPHSTASTSLSLDLLVAVATMAPSADSSVNSRQPSQKPSTHPMSISNLAFDYQDTFDTPANSHMPPPQSHLPPAPAWPRSGVEHYKLPSTLISPPITPMFSNTSITTSQVQPHSFPTTATKSDSASPTNTAFVGTSSQEPIHVPRLPVAAHNHAMQTRPHRRCVPSFQETTPPATSAAARKLSNEDVAKRGAAAKYVCRFCPKSFKRKHHVE
ncbi:hypothetical protein HDU81_001874, partial [Chytriomyces hyalinus]